MCSYSAPSLTQASRTGDQGGRSGLDSPVGHPGRYRGRVGNVYFLGLLTGTCSRSVVRGWLSAYRSVTKRPVTELRSTIFIGIVFAIGVAPNSGWLYSPRLMVNRPLASKRATAGGREGPTCFSVGDRDSLVNFVLTWGGRSDKLYLTGLTP